MPEFTKDELWQLMTALYAQKKQPDGKCFDPLYLKLRVAYAND